MTQDEIIEMARQAGFDEGLVLNVYPNFIQRFAKLVAAKEREACAKVVDDIGMFHEVSQGADLCFALSKEIQARGEA